jgi:hypothetical protein
MFKLLGFSPETSMDLWHGTGQRVLTFYFVFSASLTTAVGLFIPEVKKLKNKVM